MREIAPHCPVHADVPLLPRRRGWECPVCKKRVLSFRQWPRPEEPTVLPPEIDSAHCLLPWLVAFPLAQAREEHLPQAARREFTLMAAFAALRLAVALLLAETRQSGEGDRELAAAMGRLALPGWRPWLELGELLARRARNRSTLFPHLLAGWALLAATHSLPVLRAPSQRRIDGGEGGVDLDLPTVERIAATLFGGEGVRVVRVTTRDPARGLILSGKSTGGNYSVGDLVTASELSAADSVLALGDRWVLPLEPFLIPGEMATNPDGTMTGEPALLLVMATEGGGVFQGLGLPVRHQLAWDEPSGWPSRGGRRPVTLLSREQAAASASAVARQRVQKVREQPWHLGPLQPRPDVEAVLHTVLGQPGRALIVGGEAGCGKTVLLARLATHLLGEVSPAERSPHLAALVSGSAAEPDVVALVSGAGVWARLPGESGSRALARAVATAMGAPGDESPRLDALFDHIGASAILDRRLGRKVWLLLDAPDESEDGEALVAAIDSALPCLVTYPWLRLLLTLDLVTCRRLANPPPGSGFRFEHVRFFHSFADPESGVPRQWLQLGPLAGEMATEAAFADRQQADPSRSCPLPLTLLAASTRQALAHPLRLQLFHDSHHWVATGPADLDPQVMMAGWWVRRAEALGLPIAELARRMWEARTPGLTLAEIWRWWDEWCAGEKERAAATAVSTSPPEALIEEAVLHSPSMAFFWPPRGDTLFGPGHVLSAEAFLWLGARGELGGRALPAGRELASWIERGDGRWSLRHELASLLSGLAARLAAVGEQQAFDVFLHAKDPELAAWALSGALSASAGLEELREHWLVAAAENVEAARRLARASVIAGVEPRVEGTAAWFLHRLHSALAQHLPDDPSPRLMRATAALSCARAAAGPWAALPLLREARNDLKAVHARWPAQDGVAPLLLPVLGELGESVFMTGHTGEAEAVLRQALLMVRTQLAIEPTQPEQRRCLVAVLVTLAELATGAGRNVEAERLLTEATTRLGQLRSRDAASFEHRRLWGRVLLASGLAALGQHRLPQARALCEEAVATLRTLAEAPEAVAGRIEYVRAAMAYAALAMDDQQERVARETLEEAARVMKGPQPGCDDPIHQLCRAELVARMASFARDAVERQEHLELSRRLLEPLVAAAFDLPRLAPLWREVTQRLREVGGEGAIIPVTTQGDTIDA